MAGGGRDLPAHHLGLRRAKGRCVSKRSIFASSSSVAIVSSPTLACSRPISASRASAGRLLSDASPPARNASRQLLSSAAVTLRSRETSPRACLAPEQPEHRLLLAACRHPPLLPGSERRLGCTSVSGAPRRAHPCSNIHLLAGSYPQSGVSRNCRPG